MLSHSGLKATAELQPIYERHARVLGRDAIDLVAVGVPGRGAWDARPIGRRAADAGMGGRVTGGSRAGASSRSERSPGRRQRSCAGGRSWPFPISGRRSRSRTHRDRRERLALDEARAALVERELAPIRRERLQRERDFIEGLRARDRTTTRRSTLLSGIPLAAWSTECRRCLRGHARPCGTISCRGRAAFDWGCPVSELTRADALALVRGLGVRSRTSRARRWKPPVRRQVAEMGIDPGPVGASVTTPASAQGNGRARSAPRCESPTRCISSCARTADRRIIRRLLHELGHALHFAYTRADYPFEYRWVGDNSVTEGVRHAVRPSHAESGVAAAVFGHRTARAAAFLRAAALEELQFLRRYCAKLIYEVAAVRAGAISWDATAGSLRGDADRPRRHSAIARADAFIDVDARFYAARYLRAWQLGALLADALTEHFDDDWYRNPRAGPWIVEAVLCRRPARAGRRVRGSSRGAATVIRAGHRGRGGRWIA